MTICIAHQLHYNVQHNIFGSNSTLPWKIEIQITYLETYLNLTLNSIQKSPKVSSSRMMLVECDRIKKPISPRKILLQSTSHCPSIFQEDFSTLERCLISPVRTLWSTGIPYEQNNLTSNIWMVSRNRNFVYLCFLCIHFIAAFET